MKVLKETLAGLFYDFLVQFAAKNDSSEKTDGTTLINEFPVRYSLEAKIGSELSFSFNCAATRRVTVRMTGSEFEYAVEYMDLLLRLGYLGDEEMGADPKEAILNYLDALCANKLMMREIALQQADKVVDVLWKAPDIYWYRLWPID